MRRTLILAGCLIAAALLACLQERTPKPLPVDAPPQVFSAGRAMADVRIVGRAPHPVGSAANMAVRDHLVRRMAELGLSPQVRRMDSAAYRQVGDQSNVFGAVVENVVGVLPGLDRTAPAVLVMAHYDSVPGSPGAADDAAGVAAGLEIMRALKARGMARRDVMLLLTDGEESGLLGAGAFFRADPLARRVGFVLNMEARGGGGRAQMFETGPGAAETIALFSHTAVRPASSSLAVKLYSMTSNDTDFTRSRAAGLPGLNYAFIGRQFDYHSASSTPETLDQGALQDIGRQVLAAAAGAAFAPALPREGGEAVYANTFGSGVLAYPPWCGWIVLAVAAALWGLGVLRARRVAAVDWRDLARGAGAALYLLLLAASLLRLARRATGVPFGFIEQRALTAQAGLFEAAVILTGLGAALFAAAALGRPRSCRVCAGLGLATALGCLALGGPDLAGAGLGAAAAIMALPTFGRPAGSPGAWAGVLATGLAVTLVVQVVLPVAGFLPAWPLVLACLAAAVGRLGASRSLPARALTALAAVVALVWLGGFVHGVYLGLDMPELLAIFAWLAAFAIWPLAQPAGQSIAGRALAGAALIMGLGLVAWVRFSDPWSARHPRPTLVAYQLDQDAKRAWRVSLIPADQSAWTHTVLTADGGRIGRAGLRPLFRRPVEAAPARWLDAPAPQLTLAPAAGGQVALRAAPPPGARFLTLDLRADGVVEQPMFNGRPASILRRPGQWTHVRWEAAPGGFEVAFKPVRPGAIEVRYAAVTEAWPAAAKPLPQRPADVMGFDVSDSTVVTGSRRLTW
jgi:hypothetical protein